jgi:hypothetical protein
MDFVTSQRTDVFDNNNTAQQQFTDFLETIEDKDREHIVIDKSLHGDLDLAIMHKQGFRNTKTLEFIEGQITSIENIPKNVKSLIVSNNLLIELPSPIEHIESLELKTNYLTTADLSSAIHMKKLVVSFNHLTEIRNIPSKIRELYCSNNEIRKLDLQMADKIQVLTCSNNPNLLIEHVPDSLKTFEMENTQFQEIYKNLGNVKIDSKHVNEHNQKIEYTDALNQYFRLKYKYEVAVSKLKHDEYHKLKDKNTPKSKIKRILSEIRPPCVNCKQPNGTIFNLKSTENVRIYSAICGNTKNPCNLNIQLSSGQYMNVWTSIETTKHFLTEYKEKIIKHKLDVLFNYLGESTATSEFKTDLKDYYSTKELYEDAIKKYEDMYHNRETEEKIKEKSITLYDKLEEMDRIIGEYRQSYTSAYANPVILKDGMNVYFREIMDLSKQIYSLKNPMSEMYNPEESDIFTLKQWTTTFANMDYSYDDAPEVIKFNKLGK